jgi:hypothetical protein
MQVLHSSRIRIDTMLICPKSSSVKVFISIPCDFLRKAYLRFANFDVLVAIWREMYMHPDTKHRRSHVCSGALWLTAKFTLIVLIVASCRLRTSPSHHVRRCVDATASAAAAGKPAWTFCPVAIGGLDTRFQTAKSQDRRVA